MRVTSDLWVSALLRRVFSGGGFAAVAKRGATEAGAIFLISRDRLGRYALYGPAPQTSYDEGRPSERLFSLIIEAEAEDELTVRLDRERRFDPDLWVVDVETGGEPIESLITLTP